MPLNNIEFYENSCSTKENILSKKTLAIIKPDAVQKGFTGEIITMITKAGFKIKAMKMTHLTKSSAEGFYAIHRERPFFKDLVNISQQ